MAFGDWLDRRLGHRAILRVLFDEPVRGGARSAYVFGSALAVLFALQAVTGVLMALHYSASSREAWGSVHDFVHHVRFGWFVRGLHHWGSSAIVVLLVVHMFQVFLYGAYRPPREVGWWSGIVLLGVTLAFALTGYLLPWDQRGYWSTRVVTNIVGTFPLVGGFAKGVLQGGNDLGNLTLTRFYGFHVFVLPMALLSILAIHVIAFRRQGVTPRWSRKADEIAATTEPFWPGQVAYDVVFASVVIATLIALTVRHHGAPLSAPANPASSYPGRPEWYFLWLFELLHLFPASFEGIGTFAFSVAAFLFLVALPLADRGKTASPRDRLRHVAIATAIAVAVLGLTLAAALRDARDPRIAEQLRDAEIEARRASELAELGIPPGGASELHLNDPRERGKRLFAAQCASCHRSGGAAPDLSAYMSRAWVANIIADPTRPELYGRTKVKGMPKTEATPAQLDVLTEYVLSLSGAASAPAGGAELFEERGCHACHARAGEAPRSGPSLAGFGSRAWIAGATRTPGAASYYGENNEMPAFEGRITDEQIEELMLHLSSLPPLEPARR